IATANVDVTLAVVLLLIECELIDSGRNNWKFHVNGAKAIMKKLCPSGLSTEAPLSPLRRSLISNCLTFSLLQDAEGNHCSSMPAILLQVIQAGSRVFQQHYANHHPRLCNASEIHEQLLLLLSTARSFDASVWATILQVRSPVSDIHHRKLVASAHRTAVCVYLYRIHLSLCPDVELAYDLELLAAEIIGHLSIIQPSDALFTATTWPAFIAGAETNDSSRQAWAMRRFQELWEVEPWGLMRGAIDVLDQIWAEKRDAAVVGKRQNENWLVNLKSRGDDWLII
ncbi:acriflavine sensitivity control protein acr-2, partial [Leptodontidium sp. 2 PMI_412]